MWQMHPGVAEALGLAQAETEKLFDVLAELEMERSAMPQVFGPDGQLDQAAMDEMRRRQQEFQQRQEEALASLLGPDGPQRYREYENTRGARMEAANLGQTLQAKNTPLTEVQSRALTDIFVAEAQRQRDEAQAMQRQLQAGANSPEDVARMRQASLDLQAERNRRILDAARGHLTAQQLEVLQSEFDHQLAMNRAATRLLMQQGGGQAGFVAIQAGGVTNVAVAAGP